MENILKNVQSRVLMLGAGRRGRGRVPGLPPVAPSQCGAPQVPRRGLAGAAQLGRGQGHGVGHVELS